MEKGLSSDVSHVICLLGVVESDGLRDADSWFVDSVTVVNEKGEKWFCPCNHWLSLHHTDRQVGGD